MSDDYVSDCTAFTIPVRRDKFGGITTKQVLVSNRLLPAMADIIDAATRPVALTQQYIYNLRGTDKTLGESILQQLRGRIRADLEQQMRADAQKTNTAIITPIRHEETADDLGVLFVARAVGMPLIEIEL